MLIMSENLDSFIRKGYDLIFMDDKGNRKNCGWTGFKDVESALATFQALAEKTACFKILTEQMRLYVQKFDGKFLATKYFSKSDKKAEINEECTNLSLILL